MRQVTIEEYQRHFGIFILDGHIAAESRGGFVSLVRQCVINKPLTKRQLHQRILETLRPFTCDEIIKYTDECLAILCNQNEIKELHRREKDSIFTAVRPQWIQLDDNNAVLIGNVADDIIPMYSIDNYDVVRRFVPNDDNIDLLYGTEEIAFPALPDFATFLLEKKEKLQQQSEETINEDLLIIGGRSGDYWGSYKDTQNLTGRWKHLSASIADGVYFGCQTPNDNASWFISNKCGDIVQKLTLYDKDEWLTLFWQYTLENGQPFYTIDNDTLCFSIPLPSVVKAYLRLFASEQPQWGQWRLIYTGTQSLAYYALRRMVVLQDMMILVS